MRKCDGARLMDGEPARCGKPSVAVLRHGLCACREHMDKYTQRGEVWMMPNLRLWLLQKEVAK